MRDGSRPATGPGPAPDDIPPAPAPTPTHTPAPAVGEHVHDPARDRVGVVMGHDGPYVQLRPLGGGREWDADPDRVRRLTPSELLSARVGEANARSRTVLTLHTGAPQETPPPP